MDVNGKYNFILKFEETSGQHEHVFQGDTNGSWQTLTWDISGLNSELGDVQRILIFMEPAFKDLTGTVYIDNFKVLKTSKTDLTIDESPVVGTPIYGSYEFYDANGDLEQGSVYRWFIANELDKKFKLIKGANSRTYTPTPKDFGKYIKFEVQPKADHEPVIGGTVISSETNMVVSSADLDRPQAKNIIVKQLTLVQQTLQGIADQTVPTAWTDAGDSVYTATSEGQQDGEEIWNVDYNKNGKEWAFIVSNIEDASTLNEVSMISTRVFGNVNLLLKFEGTNGAVEQSFNLTGGDAWQTIQWDVSSFNDTLTAANKILIFAAPGNGSASGSFKLGSIKATGKGWKDARDGVYKLTPDDSNGIHVAYIKNGFEWANFNIDTDPVNSITVADRLSAIITGNAKILVKLDKAAGADVEKTFEFTGGNVPQQLIWDISSYDISDLRKVLIFVAPGDGTATGTFNMKDVTITGQKLDSTSSPEIAVGTKLYGDYMFEDRNGNQEIGSTYCWLSSKSADGHYSIIKGANERTYTVTTKEYWEYLKFEVVAKTVEEPSSGFPYLSGSVKVEESERH